MAIIKIRYSIEAKDRIYVKGYGLLSFAKNMNNKYSQKLFDSATHATKVAKKCMTDATKTVSKRAVQKTGEATGDLIGNKIANKLQKSQKLRKTI